MPAAAPATWAGVPAVDTVVNGWSYLGCKPEITGRVLRGPSYTSTTAMTIESCMAFCSTNNFGVAGVEYGQECYCANSVSTGAALASPAKCDMSCKGSAGEKCGGSNSVSVFNNTAYKPPVAPVKAAGGWTYASCYMEPQTGRALPDKLWADPAMTVDKCTAFCSASGFPWAGLEYGDECWCAKALTKGLKDASDPTCAMQCDMQCVGNNHQICGGAGAINIYKNPGAGAAKNKRAAVADGADGVFTRNGRFVKMRKPEQQQ